MYMKAYRLEISAAVVLVALMLLSYLANPILPVFVVTVIGLPVALFLMARDPHG
jgi:uncharacterized membrane protein